MHSMGVKRLVLQVLHRFGLISGFDKILGMVKEVTALGE